LGIMCEKCVEIDQKIEHHRLLASQIADPATVEGIQKLIDGMNAQKRALHPEQEK
jgi:hypothetical protein